MADDRDLKVRLSTIFWALGCYTRLEVKLAEYSPQRDMPLELTDLDVLGIRITPELSFDHLVADCTSNRYVLRSPIQRAFWLRGVMEFFGAATGYLALNTPGPISENQRLVAHRLGVTILNTDNLGNLENRVRVADTASLQMTKRDSWVILEKNLQQLPQPLHPLLTLRRHRYWLNPPYQNLHSVISLCARHAKDIDESNRHHVALVLDLLSLFSVALLKMTAYVAKTNPENPEVELRAYFFGGYPEMRRRESIIENVKQIVAEVPGQKELFAEKLRLDPDYLRTLFELAYRLLNRPEDSRQLPRYLQAVLFEKTLYKSENSDGVKYLNERFSEVTKKFARDVVRFFRDATGLGERVFADLI